MTTKNWRVHSAVRRRPRECGCIARWKRCTARSFASMEYRSMSEKSKSGVPFESSDAKERELWDSLEGISQSDPPPRLRRKFYSELDKLGRQTGVAPWREWLGL